MGYVTLRSCYEGLPSRAMRTRLALLSLALLPGIAACSGGDDGGASSADAPPTTLSALGTTTFRTIPAAPSSLSPAPADAAAAGGVIGAAPTTYEIVAGDTPSGIAKRLGCPTWQEIAAYNNIDPDDFMSNTAYPGDSIDIPDTCIGGDAAAAAAEAPPTATAAPGAPPATEASAEVSGSEYEVQAGDTLFGIAQKLDTSMDAIVAANGWSDGIDHVLIPGKKIKLPAPSAG
jgi:N-acetylmuramoyl-L-alanine amidase